MSGDAPASATVTPISSSMAGRATAKEYAFSAYLQKLRGGAWKKVLYGVKLENEGGSCGTRKKQSSRNAAGRGRDAYRPGKLVEDEPR